MKKKTIKGWNKYQDGYRLNRTVTLQDGSRERLYTGKVYMISEGEKELERRTAERNAEIQAEIERRQGICPLGDYIEHYLNKLPDRTSKKTGRPYAPSTIERKRDLYDCQIKSSALAQKKITEVTRRDIEIFKVELEETVKSNNKKKIINNNTKNKVLTLLVEVFADFYRTAEHPENNPMIGVERYTESYGQKTMDDFLDQSEIVALMQTNKRYYVDPRPRTNDRQYSEVIDLCIIIHARPGEILALKAKDYDPETGELKIRRTLTMHQVGKDGSAKTRQSLRVVELIGKDKEIVERNCQGKKANDLLFVGAQGGVISESDLNRAFKHRLQESGIEKNLTMYRTRGTGITFALMHGADPAGVAAISGHSQKTMYQHYSAITAQQKKSAAETTKQAYDVLLQGA